MNKQLIYGVHSVPTVHVNQNMHYSMPTMFKDALYGESIRMYDERGQLSAPMVELRTYDDANVRWYAKDANGIVYTNCSEGYTDAKREEQEFKMMPAGQKARIQQEQQELKDKFRQGPNITSHSSRNDLDINNTKYINSQGKGFAVSSNFVTTACDLHHAFAKDTEGIMKFDDRIPIREIIRGNEHAWYDYFSKTITPDRIAQQFGSQAYNEAYQANYNRTKSLIENAGLSIGDLRNGIHLQLRDAQKNVLHDIHHLESFKKIADGVYHFTHDNQRIVGQDVKEMHQAQNRMNASYQHHFDR